MPDDINEPWHVLPAYSSQFPNLFLTRCTFGTDNYSIQVTDLSQVWIESLNRQQIISRAHEDDTSIDPSEDDEQLQIFLQKVRAAINGEKNTSLSIERGIRRNGLQVNVVSELPRPLKSFKWKLHLQHSPETTVSSEFIIPLLRSSYTQHQRVEELSRLLEEKDNAISKMLDKVESMGIDLYALFPKANATRSSRKDKSRELISQHVRGMGPFEKDKWLKSFPNKNHTPVGVRELIHDAFAGENALASDDFSKLLESGPPDVRPTVEWSNVLPNTGNSTEHSSNELEEDFQRQVTPPSAKKLQNVSEHSEVRDADFPASVEHSTPSDNDTTEDESTNHSGSHNRDQRLSGAERDTASGKSSGLLETSRMISKERDMQNTSPRQKLGRIGGSKLHKSPGPAQDDREYGDNSGSGEQSRVQSEGQDIANKATRHRLGRIGGAAARQEEAGDSTTTSTVSSFKSDQADRSTVSKPSPRKLGRIGGIQGRTSDAKTPHTSAKLVDDPDVEEHHAETFTQRAGPRRLGRIGGRANENKIEAKESRNDGTTGETAGRVSPSRASESNPEALDSGARGNDLGERDVKGSKEDDSKESSAPVESAEQKADRKREELKRQLDEKSKAPVKKRRRF